MAIVSAPASRLPFMNKTFFKGFRPAYKDSLSICLPASCERSSNQNEPWKICAVAHCHHSNIFDEVRFLFDNLPGQIDVLLSTDTVDKAEILGQKFHSWQKGCVKISIIENIGRDLTSKLIAFNPLIASYQLALFVHTKQDAGLIDAGAWRKYLYHNLAGSTDISLSIINIFKHNKDVGIVFPNHWPPIRPWIRHMNNYRNMKKLAGLMKIKISRFSRLDFPSGSMFWARPDALRPLLDLGLTVEDFPTEPVPKDGTILHAIERLILHSCEKAGLKWLKVVDPKMALATDKLVVMKNNNDIRNVIERTGSVLKT